jgi:putative heme transporter
VTARVRQVVAVGLLLGALYAGWTRRNEIHHGLDGLDHPAWAWLLAACAVQAGSMVVFARLQRWLLRCGGVRVRLRDMIEITLAGNALSTSLPGGAAWAAGWVWGQLRRRSVERVLAGWVVLVAGALSSFALFLLVAIGAEIAGSRGPVASLLWVTRALLIIAVLAGVGVVALARSSSLQARWAARAAAAAGRPGLTPRVVRLLDTFGHDIRIVTPSPTAWGEALLLALANWGADLATLVFCVWTVHASVPWRGIVVAYSLTQIAASIPITPGGLAVVEASLAALLVGFGMSSTTAVTVVLLYRLISFWCLVPIGWGAWGLLELTQRRSTTRHHPWAVHRHRPLPPVAVEPASVVSGDAAADSAAAVSGAAVGGPAAAVGSVGTADSGDLANAPAHAGSSAHGLAAMGTGISGVPLPAAELGGSVTAELRRTRHRRGRRLAPGGPQGPERILRPAECDGCDETEDPVESRTPASSLSGGPPTGD